MGEKTQIALIIDPLLLFPINSALDVKRIAQLVGTNRVVRKRKQGGVGTPTNQLMNEGGLIIILPRIKSNY